MKVWEFFAKFFKIDLVHLYCGIVDIFVGNLEEIERVIFSLSSVDIKT